MLTKENDYKGTYEEWLESIKGDTVVLSVIDDEIKWKYKEEADAGLDEILELK